LVVLFDKEFPSAYIESIGSLSMGFNLHSGALVRVQKAKGIYDLKLSESSLLD
jgi:hypothetical protein